MKPIISADACLPEYDDNPVAFENSASFDSFSVPSLTGHLFPPGLESNSISDDESIRYVSGHEYGRSPFQAPRSPSLEVPSGEVPEVMSFSPTSGPDGSSIVVYLQSAYDLFAAPIGTYALTFGSARSECAIRPLGFHNSAFQYALLVDAPAFGVTGCPTLSVPLQLIVDGEDCSAPHVSHIGNFIYDQELVAMGPSPPRKRRISSASEETSTSTGSFKQVRVNENMPSFAYNGGVSPTPYSPYLSSPASTCAYSPVQYQATASPSLMPAHPEVHQQHMAQLRVKAPSPLSASWSPSFSAVSTSTRSPTLSATPVHGSGVGTPVKPAGTPLLVRTSTIQQSLNGSSTSNQAQAFNPYAMYPSKAVLKLNGDLDTMTEGWTKEERTSQRRLVQFTRRQEGSTIHADFKPVGPADRLPNSICISCINWDGKDECYVTSVDTIYVLECLVGVRFTVEEKNRIRRNLEGFRPLTVSKTKTESEDFFKVIMGFPNPKPRNIEKDVKVFPWRILAHALKKIIGKYVSQDRFSLFKRRITNLDSLQAIHQRLELTRVR